MSFVVAVDFAPGIVDSVGIVIFRGFRNSFRSKPEFLAGGLNGTLHYRAVGKQFFPVQQPCPGPVVCTFSDNNLVEIGIHELSLDTLFQIAGAGDGACAFPRFAQRRKQHGSEDGDDRNYDKKFYKSKKVDDSALLARVSRTPEKRGLHGFDFVCGLVQ